MPPKKNRPTLAQVPLAKIDPPHEAHRTVLDATELEQLAAHIKQHGLIQPIALRLIDDDRYEIIAGHRRYLATAMIGAATIAATIITVDTQQSARLRLAENTLRADLSPMEEARALTLIYGTAMVAPSLIARDISRSEHWVRQRLQLLDIPLDMQTLVHDGALSIGHALALAQITDDTHRNYLLAYAKESGASLAVMREWVDQWKLAQQQTPGSDAPKPSMPAPGTPPVILMPCFLCGTAYDYKTLTIARCCDDCVNEVQTPTAQPPTAP